MAVCEGECLVFIHFKIQHKPLTIILLLLYLNLVKILECIKFTYAQTNKSRAWFLQHKPALFTPNLHND